MTFLAFELTMNYSVSTNHLIVFIVFLQKHNIMGITKSDIHEDHVVRMSQYAKAFAHPARITILRHIIKQKVCIVNDLVEVIGLSQSTISQHLKELKNIGIITGEIEGPRICYCINEKVWNETKKVFEEIFSSYTPPSCC